MVSPPCTLRVKVRHFTRFSDLSHARSVRHSLSFLPMLDLLAVFPPPPLLFIFFFRSLVCRDMRKNLYYA
jgi:hypothetical protein